MYSRAGQNHHALWKMAIGSPRSYDTSTTTSKSRSSPPTPFPSLQAYPPLHQQTNNDPGTWQAAPGEVAAAVTTALKAGYKLIDAAYCYGNEDEVGQGIQAAIDAGYVTRAEIFVVTKLWNTYATRAAVGLDKSLAALGLDYVDQFLVHWAVGMNPAGDDDRFPRLPDGARDITWDHDHTATWRAMEALLATGKTRSIGVCNYSVPYLEQLLKTATVVPAVNQIENHPALPQQEVVDFCQAKGIHVVAYSPLGSTGGPLMKSAPVVQVAERKGVSPGTVLLSYHGEALPQFPSFPKLCGNW